MKYEITKEVVEAVHKTLYSLNIPCQTLDAIVQTLTKTPIAETPKTDANGQTTI